MQSAALDQARQAFAQVSAPTAGLQGKSILRPKPPQGKTNLPARMSPLVIELDTALVLLSGARHKRRAAHTTEQTAKAAPESGSLPMASHGLPIFRSLAGAGFPNPACTC